MSPNTSKAPPIATVDFPRRNKQSGSPEILRVEATEFNGRIFTNLRMFYSVTPRGPDDDGWRPDRDRGANLRETDLDAAIAVLEAARAQVHAEGRSTSDAKSSDFRGERWSNQTAGRGEVQGGKPRGAVPNQDRIGQRAEWEQPADDEAPF